MKRRTLLNAVTLGCAVGLVPGILWDAAAEQPLEQAYDALMRARRAAGLPDLTRQPALMASGRAQVVYMQALGQTHHMDAFGHSPDVRAARLGYEGRVLGEVLAETYGPPSETLEAWLTAPETRAVLLDPDAREVGLAMNEDREGRMWWVAMTGAKQDNFT